jgi:hypothetical protein
MRAGQLTGLRCPSPEGRYSEVWVTSTRDWESHRRLILHCRNGHLLAWAPEDVPNLTLNPTPASCETRMRSGS